MNVYPVVARYHNRDFIVRCIFLLETIFYRTLPFASSNTGRFRPNSRAEQINNNNNLTPAAQPASDGFKQLVMQHAIDIPPNTEKGFLSEAIGCLRPTSMVHRVHPRLFAFWIVTEHPFFFIVRNESAREKTFDHVYCEGERHQVRSHVLTSLCGQVRFHFCMIFPVWCAP